MGSSSAAPYFVQMGLTFDVVGGTVGLDPFLICILYFFHITTSNKIG